jgi:hypothetical protein
MEMATVVVGVRFHAVKATVKAHAMVEIERFMGVIEFALHMFHFFH